jgi:hypothetical protein
MRPVRKQKVPRAEIRRDFLKKADRWLVASWGKVHALPADCHLIHFPAQPLPQINACDNRFRGVRSASRRGGQSIHDPGG